MSRMALTEKQLYRFKALLYTFPQIEQMILFGSRATGDTRVGSDIDMYVKVLGNIAVVRHELWLASGIVPIDVVTVEDLEASPELAAEIKQNGIDLIQYFGLKHKTDNK